MNRAETEMLMGIMKTAFPRFCMDLVAGESEYEATVGLWHTMVGHVDFNTAQRALVRLIATLKFPPTIAEMLESIDIVLHGTPLDEGDAWLEVNDAIRAYGHRREGEAMNTLSGPTQAAVKMIGWTRLCLSSSDSEVADRAHFFKVYKTVVNRKKEDRLIAPAMGRVFAQIGQDVPKLGDSGGKHEW